MPKGWDLIFGKKGRVFTGHHPSLPQVVKIFKRRGVKRVLDLGCGTGRHVVYLVRKGFEVYGFDASKTGVRHAEQWLAGLGLKADLKVSDMARRFPYKTGLFDAIISTNVIHHNKLAGIHKTIQQMVRVLRPKGMAFITIPSHLPISIRIRAPTTYKHIEINTFLPLDGDEKGLVHHIFDEEGIKKEFKKFRILKIHKDSYDHWCVLMQKK